MRPAVITSVPGGQDGTEAQADPAASANGDRGTPDFRYLVVPLRMPGGT